MSCVAAAARLVITSFNRSGAITETTLVRCRNAAMTMAACDVIMGDPSGAHIEDDAATAVSAMSEGLPAIISSRS